MIKAANHDTYFIPGLHRGLRVLEVLSAADGPMSLTDIAQALGVSRSSAFRLVYTLRQMEFLKEATQRNTYTLGARVLNLGFAYLNDQPITAIARPHLAALRDEVGLSSHLSVLEGIDVLFLGSNQARTGFASTMTTGTRQRAYASPIGWCLLADKDDTALRAFCEGQEMVALTEHTPTDFEALRARVAAAREAGHVVSRGFLDRGGSSIAFPVRDNAGRIAACISISGPDSGFDFARLDAFYVPAVRETAQRISRELGHAT